MNYKKDNQMEKFKGTKGKWEACSRTNHVQTSTIMTGREIPGFQTICSVNTVFISKEKAKANAQLISKAPEMLEKLNSILNFEKETGREGCYYSDTNYNSVDVAYGYNLAIEHIQDGLEKLIKEATEI